jgi:uncharacterized membrane protein
MTLLASLFFGAGVGGWVYTQMTRRTGNADPTQVALVSGLSALAAFIFFFTLIKYVLHLG